MTNNGTHTWPELAAELYDKLTGRKAEITYEFENMDIAVPNAVGDGSNRARWNINGALKIRTRDLDAAGSSFGATRRRRGTRSEVPRRRRVSDPGTRVGHRACVPQVSGPARHQEFGVRITTPVRAVQYSAFGSVRRRHAKDSRRLGGDHQAGARFPRQLAVGNARHIAGGSSPRRPVPLSENLIDICPSATGCPYTDFLP